MTIDPEGQGAISGADAGFGLVWFRNDLRCIDHTALHLARAAGPVVAGYCLCPVQLAGHGVGGNRLALTLRALGGLAERLRMLGIPLRIVQRETFDAVPDALLALCREVGAKSVYFNDEYPLNEQRRDQAVEALLRREGIGVHRCTDSVLHAPGTLLTGSGGPYTVFTPFLRRWRERTPAEGLRVQGLPPAQTRPPIDDDEIPQLPAGFSISCDVDAWPADEDAARGVLEQFTGARIHDYASARDRVDQEGTSGLSAALSLGLVSPRQCLAAALMVNGGEWTGPEEGATRWINELVWREFYRHVVHAFPHVSKGRSFRTEYDGLPWREDAQALEAWRGGETGFPIIDAAMRQLHATGWMHNRLRMIVAMFLSKNLLLDWRHGEAHFMHHLVDGDFASNNGGWQWSASTGTDAAPYFRIFSPASQAAKCDPEGDFIRRWLPEIAHWDTRDLHDPERRATAGDDLFREDTSYPAPIVSAKESRKRAIEVFRAFSSGDNDR